MPWILWCTQSSFICNSYKNKLQQQLCHLMRPQRQQGILQQQQVRYPL
ncbi:hypothetical protein DOY81_008721 [Sarcophaga bullata]|nr:hypothetical protein DOY81_008721 [Sarcophaga bullata]